MKNQFARLQLLIGKDGLERIKSKRVIVFGLGGVGGNVCDALVRSGVSNINRVSVSATVTDTSGVDKTELLSYLFFNGNSQTSDYILNASQEKALKSQYSTSVGFDVHPGGETGSVVLVTSLTLSVLKDNPPAQITLNKIYGGVNYGSVTLTEGQVATVSAINETGYTFNGWNTKADGTGTAYTTSLTAEQVNTLIANEIEFLYAQMSPNTYNITFNKNLIADFHKQNCCSRILAKRVKFFFCYFCIFKH